MKRIKELKFPLISLAIFTVAYTAIVFIIGGVVSKERGIDSAYIATYLMMLIALVIYCYSLFVGISDKPGAIMAVNGPGLVAFIYLVFTFITTTVLYFINYSDNMVYVMIFYLFAVTVFLMCYIPALHHVTIVKQQPRKLPKVKRVQDLVAYYESFVGYVKEDLAKQEIEGIIDSIRNLPAPIKKGRCKKVEKQIIEYSTFVQRDVANMIYSNVYHNIDKVKELIAKRVTL